MAIVEFSGGRITHRYLMNKRKDDLAHMILHEYLPILGRKDKRIAELEAEVERVKKLGHKLLDIIENTPNGCVPLPYGFLIEMWRKAFGERKEE